jgi:DNA repair exonuclease SbcCD ATPase subunit
LQVEKVKSKSKTEMKKYLIPLILLCLLLIGGVVWLYLDLDKQKQENREMQELAELDKQEMETEYQQFALQYSEMKTQINNDSIVAQLSAEQEKTQRLLKELQQVKASDAREITRLKKELATVRAVLRSYVIEIDSLNRLNQNLQEENTRVKAQYEEATQQIEGLSSEKQSLSEKVAIAAQLDAIGISMQAKDKRNKNTDHASKAKTLQVNFALAKNVTAQNGMRTVYVRISSPTGSLLGNAGSFNYENRTLQCSMKKAVEYGGQETPVTLYWNVDQALVGGTYQVSIFADGNLIGSRSMSLK